MHKNSKWVKDINERIKTINILGKKIAAKFL
jgi:hypothetical protein